MVGSRDAPSPGHRRRPRRTARRHRERRRRERRSARRLAAGLRVAQPVQVGRGDQRRDAGDDHVRPADRAASRATRRSTTAPRARHGRRRLARRQDDHVPPALRHPLVGRHSRSRAPTRCGRSTPCCRTRPTSCTARSRRSSRSRRRIRTRSSCTSRRATRSSSTSSRSRSCRRTSGRSTRSAKLDKIDGPVPTVTTAPYVLTKWEKLGTTILTRNDKYDTFRNGGKLPDVKRILITYYANPDSIYRDVTQGHLDYGYGGLADLGAARQDRQQPERPPDLLPARRLLGDRVQLLPEDRLADLQRPGQGRQDRRRAGSVDPQGDGLRDRPREVSSRPSTTARARPPTA